MAPGILPIYCRRVISVRLLGSDLFGRESRKSISASDYQQLLSLAQETTYTIRIPVGTAKKKGRYLS